MNKRTYVSLKAAKTSIMGIVLSAGTLQEVSKLAWNLTATMRCLASDNCRCHAGQGLCNIICLNQGWYCSASFIHKFGGMQFGAVQNRGIMSFDDSDDQKGVSYNLDLPLCNRPESNQDELGGGGLTM